MIALPRSTADLIAQLDEQRLESVRQQNALERKTANERTSVEPSGSVHDTQPNGSITASRAPKPALKQKPRKSPRKENNIQVIQRKDGTTSYRVQFRARKDGKVHSLTKTFTHLANARQWRARTAAKIELNGFPFGKEGGTTVAEIIDARLSQGRKLERSAQQNLQFVKSSYFGSLPAASLAATDLYNFAEHLLNGERSSQTVAGYMTHLASTLKWASRRDYDVPVEVIIRAQQNLWEDELLARSDERSRRPSLSELDKIMTVVEGNRRQSTPLGKIIAFAIFSTRRLGEICRLRWEDLDEADSSILVREMKHPRKKRVNNVRCKLTPEALRIIQSMPRSSEFIFPYNSRSVGTAFRRHRVKAGVLDLRFHDLRHEGISRLFEMELTDRFVAKISGHQVKGGCLDRYEHVEEVGDKYENWSWLDRVIVKSF